MCSVWEMELVPGQLLIVPHSLPHEAWNLEDSVAIAGNFVDAVNWDDFVQHLQVATLGTQASEAHAVLASIEVLNMSRPAPITSATRAKTWAEFNKPYAPSGETTAQIASANARGY